MEDKESFLQEVTCTMRPKNFIRCRQAKIEEEKNMIQIEGMSCADGKSEREHGNLKTEGNLIYIECRF